MTLKPPTRTFPKLVMKEWPERQYIPSDVQYVPMFDADGFMHLAPPSPCIVVSPKALSDFTRVVEKTGILDQKEAP